MRVSELRVTAFDLDLIFIGVILVKLDLGLLKSQSQKKRFDRNRLSRYRTIARRIGRRPRYRCGRINGIARRRSVIS